jgi:hypothetical protein
MKETFEGFIKWMIDEDQELFLECLLERTEIIDKIIDVNDDYAALEKENVRLQDNENVRLQDLETVHRMICTDRLQDAIDLINQICDERFMSIEQFKRMGLK